MPLTYEASVNVSEKEDFADNLLELLGNAGPSFDVTIDAAEEPLASYTPEDLSLLKQVVEFALLLLMANADLFAPTPHPHGTKRIRSHPVGFEHDSETNELGFIQVACVENTFRFFLAKRLESYLGADCACWLSGPEVDLVSPTGETATGDTDRLLMTASTNFAGVSDTVYIDDSPCG